MTNAEIAKTLREIASLLDMQGVPFKPRAYEKAAHAVKITDLSVEEIYRRDGLKGLTEISGVGAGIAEKIATLIQTGRLPYLEALREKSPVDLARLSLIEGLGPKTINTLHAQIGIRTVEDLERAALAGKIRELPRFGEKSEQKILKGIAFLKSGGRHLLGAVLPLANDIQARLEMVPGVKQVAVAGSIRRRMETVGNADLLVISNDPDRVMDYFVGMPEAIYIHAKGPTQSRIKLSNRMNVDLRVVSEESFGAALCYFTGSKAHNIALREIAIAKQLKLNEYGVFREDRPIAGRTEEEVYAALGLPFIPPELREDAGEIGAALVGALPELIDYHSLRGDLQIQTNWTDGAHSIEEMAAEAKRLGREYIAITDHTKSLTVTKGADEEKLRRQMAAIDALNKKRSGITLLKGAEVNILKDGRLDISNETLAQLDVVGISVHSHFGLPREEMTRRVIRAMKNPHADILFHPTGRRIQRREPVDIDIDAVIQTAKETGTVLEIDAYPDRLDLKDEHIRKAVEAGVKLVIDSDAHHIRHLSHLHFGIGMARRGWAERSDILNTLGRNEFLESLKDGRRNHRRAA
ncbi:DNA polymerase/3'-5' exonuclease PolX [Candidatus Manganitrophus noduliformans]|uniref:DNA-directed DNA polymerase n=1 Tax=Candidatus Manganitrophus noduliformans TaxID=2606439 RepID=A0A7X6DTX2_9BACT|nr:DNA polymerase/3'-5' exonuclease PolX [Candidatus Manganitrophus noduliformans]NKE73230.1 DNA polymerase/3'-5' exonuclease PolX [Candidatus Manganitrophus noduliformans]